VGPDDRLVGNGYVNRTSHFDLSMLFLKRCRKRVGTLPVRQPIYSCLFPIARHMKRILKGRRYAKTHSPNGSVEATTQQQDQVSLTRMRVWTSETNLLRAAVRNCAGLHLLLSGCIPWQRLKISAV